MDRLLALVAAVAVFALFAQTWHRYTGDGPSPVDTSGLPDWVKRLLGRDPEPDPGPDPEPARKGYRLIEDSATHTTVEWLPSLDDLPPAAPAPHLGAHRKERIRDWIRASFDGGARYGQVLAEGQRMFAVSESTMKREIRKARARP